MGWSARQWLKLVPEASYGVAQSEGAVGTATGPIYVPLHSDNAFTVVKTPYRHEVRTADARNRPIINIGTGGPSPRFTVAGALNTYLYADEGVAVDPFAQTMLDWIALLTSDDLGSYTATHYDSGRVRQWVGGKVRQGRISGANEQDEGAIRLALDLVFQKEVTPDPVFAEPNTAGNTTVVFPRSIYNFREAAGALNLGGARTKFKSFDLTVANNLLTPFDENAYISNASYGGRTIDWMFAIQYQNHNDRDAFEAQAALSGDITFTKASPAHSLAFDFNGVNIMTGLDRDLPIAGLAYETVHLRSFVDTSIPGDFSYTVT